MGETKTRKPASPDAAERARSIAKRGGNAALLPSGEASTRVTPHLHHVHADGTATILLPNDHPIVGATWHAPRAEIAAVLEIADPTPVRLREPIRGLLWLTGWMRLLDEDEAHHEVLSVVDDRPDPRLLDAGHTAQVLRLESASMVLADAEGTSPIEAADFQSATPDPFCTFEEAWLRHLELSHRDVVEILARHLPEELRGGHIRPLGLDRYGLRLRVESADGDHDVRLAFSQPTDTTENLGKELRRLVGCPFLAEQRRREP